MGNFSTWARSLGTLVLIGATSLLPTEVVKGRESLTIRFLSEDLEPDTKVAGWNHKTVRFVWDGTPRSGVLFGAAPNVGSSQVAYGSYSIVDRNDSDPPSMPEQRPEWITHSGYAVIRGWYPIIRTNIVRAVSDSTTLAVEINKNLGTHRVYLIQGERAEVEVLQGEHKGRVLTLRGGQFIEVGASGSRLGEILNPKEGDEGMPIWQDFGANDFYVRLVNQRGYRDLEVEFPE